MQQIAPEGNNPVLNEETLLNIIKSIKNLESLHKDMKSSILTSVESKLQEMITTLVSAFDNSKTYSEAVQKSPIVIDTSSADEGYFNNTIDTTADANSSQTIPKTVYPIVRRTTSCAITAAGVVPCGGPKKSPRTSSIVQIIFSFWSFKFREDILRNQKIIIGLDSYSNQR